jgi:hypothetical protein
VKSLLLVALLSACATASAGNALADPPPGDTCGSAIAIDFGSEWTFAGDLAPCANDYDPGVPGPSCTGSVAPGKDLVLAIYVSCGQFVTVDCAPIGFDGAIYIVTDCSDVTGSCLAGSDAHGVGGSEYVSLFSSTSRTYYIIVDAHDAGTGGPFSLSLGYGAWDFPPGACCFPDGHCQVVFDYQCLAAGGNPQSPCSDCDPNSCVATPVREGSWGALKARYR